MVFSFAVYAGGLSGFIVTAIRLSSKSLLRSAFQVLACRKKIREDSAVIMLRSVDSDISRTYVSTVMGYADLFEIISSKQISETLIGLSLLAGMLHSDTNKPLKVLTNEDLFLDSYIWRFCINDLE